MPKDVFNYCYSIVVAIQEPLHAALLEAKAWVRGFLATTDFVEREPAGSSLTLLLIIYCLVVCRACIQAKDCIAVRGGRQMQSCK